MANYLIPREYNCFSIARCSEGCWKFTIDDFFAAVCPQVVVTPLLEAALLRGFALVHKCRSNRVGKSLGKVA